MCDDFTQCVEIGNKQGLDKGDTYECPKDIISKTYKSRQQTLS